MKDEDLVSLHSDKRWQDATDRIRLNKLEKEGKIDKLLGDTLNKAVTWLPAIFPIQDEPNVNKRRASVGLGPLEDYARYFGIDYHLPSPGGRSDPPPSH